MESDQRIEQLEKEIEALKERLSEARRNRSAEPIADHALLGSGGERVMLSELFGDQDDLMIIHNMGQGCAYCTMWADGFNGVLPYLEDRAAVVVLTPDDPSAQAAFAASRGWNFRMISGQGNELSQTLGFTLDDGTVWAGVSALRRDADGSIVRTGQDTFEPGDDYNSPWRLFDLLSGGAGAWEPRFHYDRVAVAGD